jgi:hypothetical protein
MITRILEATLREVNKLRANLDDLHMENIECNAEGFSKRATRRIREREIGIVIPPGPWDEDLDNYPERSYEFDLGDGFTGKISRSMFMTWNGYVIVPEGHWSVGRNYTEHDDRPNSSYADLAHITYHNDRTIGFDHCHSYDAKPLDPLPNLNKQNYWLPTPIRKEDYTTYEMAIAEVKELANLLKGPNPYAPLKPMPPPAALRLRSWAKVAAGHK